MWNAIVNWLKAQGGVAHVLALSIAGAVAAYAAVPAFATLVNDLYATTPAWFHEIALAAIGIYLTYFSPTAKKA